MQTNAQLSQNAVRYDRRACERVNVCLPVNLMVAGVNFKDCLVKDLSKGGARILVPPVTWIPKRFIIRCPNGEFELAVEKIWDRLGEVGVRFLQAEMLARDNVQP